MRVLTFGVQVAEVAVDVETGEVRVDRVAAVHDVGRIINPLGARSQVEGGIIQAVGYALSEQRIDDPATGIPLTRTLDAYKVPTIADVPEIVAEFVDVPDEHLTNLGSKGLGEPPIIPTAAAIANAIRDATGADVHSLPITREELLRALREARERARGRGCSSYGLARSRKRARRWRTAPGARSPAEPSSFRCSATASSRRRRSSSCGRSSRAGVEGTTIGAGTTLAELEVDPQVPHALREACRLAASPQMRAMGTIGGNLLQATRCWYWRLKFPCWLHGGERCLAKSGAHREHAIFGNERCASAHPSDPAAALVALGAPAADERAGAAGRRALPAADRLRPLHLHPAARRADPRARSSRRRTRART